MKRIVASLVIAGCALVFLPLVAAAQCEGGPTITGMYGPGGVYVPAHCAYTNPTTPGQLYPSGAQPVPSTNPAAGASALPGQRFPSGLLPVNSSDLGPAPSYVSTPGLAAGGLPATAPGVAAVPATTSVATTAGLPSEFPATGLPAVNGNLAVPAALAVFPGLGQPNLAYSFSLPAAPPRETLAPQPPADSDTVVIAYPNQ